jgi:hypothetical protein
MSLRTVQAVRYVAPLREGGSMPGLIEADDGRLYVVKMRGAGQGTLALAAEVITGEIARTLGLNVPEIVLVEIDPVFGRNEGDPEIRDLLKASAGVNAGLEFLPESTMFDPAAGDVVSCADASLTVWLDAFTLNVDRTSRNANLLLWRDDLWLIDHGASLYFHHNWAAAQEKAASPFEAIREHILLPGAAEIPVASELAHEALSREELERILHLAPDDWLVPQGESGVTADERREAYLRFFTERLSRSRVFEEEVLRVRDQAGA